MSLNKSNIDYLKHSGDLINRPGYTLNIITGCKHGCPYCYARRMVEHGRLKGHPSYPYGFSPTFHPERIRAYGGKPKLIFLNDMGDVGGDWIWRIPAAYQLEDYGQEPTPEYIARKVRNFCGCNPEHIFLLLTKNPSWYRFAEWPDNVWCGFTATTNEEKDRREREYFEAVNHRAQTWLSLEPWLDKEPPETDWLLPWYVIGGLSGPNARPVSRATRDWLCDTSVKAKRFTKRNAGWGGGEHIHIFPREYPDSWRVEVQDVLPRGR